MLSEFGKFPAFEENWKPSDFNETKALIFIKEAESVKNYIVWPIKPESTDFLIFTSNRIKDMLHFELHLSRGLITDILEDYEQFIEKNKNEKTSNVFFKHFKLTSIGSLNQTTTRYVYYDL